VKGKQLCEPLKYSMEEIAMGKLTENIKGNVNEMVGKAKQNSDKPEDKAEGKTQEMKGKAQQAKGKVHGALGDDI
jgi:uncharacterized protein YjbJ (UPF0337 family)